MTAARATDARRAAFAALVIIERHGARHLQDVLQLDGLGDADRRLALELARGVERMRLLLDFVVEPLTERGLPRDPQPLTALRMGAYQILFLPGIREHAAVNESVALVNEKRGFVNAVLRRLLRGVVHRRADRDQRRRELELPGAQSRTLLLERGELPDPATDPAGYHAICQGLPRFLVQRWIAQYGLAAAIHVARACAVTPAVILRARQCEMGAELAQRLAREGVLTEPTEHASCLRWSGGQSPFTTAAFAEGWFVAQDPTALRAAQALAVQPGDRVLDLCAAPGTKATWLAEGVRPGGMVVAHDVDAARLEKVRENVRRMRLEDALEVVADPHTLPPMDRVLVDVPCSNTGVLARRVEIRRRISEGAIRSLAAQQVQLLRQALGHAKPGGRVVYATCSIEPEENEDVVRAVLPAGAHLIEECLTLPDTPRHDGGYFALLERAAVGDVPSSEVAR